MNKKHLQRIESIFHEKDIYDFSDMEMQELQDEISVLCQKKVLQDLEMNCANAYRRIGDFSVFDEWYKEQERQEKRETRSTRWHDVRMVVLGALLGGIVEYILFRFFGIGC